jgi:ABC-type polysaccharide/polyol phosphate transport system ATPase subunit
VLASHSEEAVQRFCTKGVVLEHGRVRFYGPADEALAVYRDHRSSAAAMSKNRSAESASA